MRTRSAALELTLLTVSVMALLLAATTWLSIRWYRSWLLEEAGRGLALATDVLHGSLRDGMMENQREQIEQTLGRVAHDPRIEHIRITNQEGEIRLSANREDLNQRLGIDLEELVAGDSTSLTKIESETLRAFRTVLAEPDCLNNCHQDQSESGLLGVINVDMSLANVERTLVQSRFQLIGLFFLTIGSGSALLGLGLAFRFRRPMSDLLQGIRRVAEGDLSHRIPVRTHDEFGEVADAFNKMGRQLTTMQQGLIQSERLISMGRLAAGVAHEINNPLTGILSYAEELVEDAEPSDPRRKDYKVILNETLRCRQIVRSLLDFAGQRLPAPIRSRPRELIEKALDIVARQASFRNIRFEKEIEEDVPQILVDPVQIQQVLINLIINAQQAMPEGGTITLKAGRTEDRRRIEFTVGDEGTGIPPEIRDRIFEPFFSTKDGATDGLGLAVCLGIVQQHHGRIDFASEPGKGTAVRIILPVAPS